MARHLYLRRDWRSLHGRSDADGPPAIRGPRLLVLVLSCFCLTFHLRPIDKNLFGQNAHENPLSCALEWHSSNNEIMAFCSPWSPTQGVCARVCGVRVNVRVSISLTPDRALVQISSVPNVTF